MSELTCRRCERPIAAAALLASASGYAAATDSGTAICPACHQSLEFRIRGSSLELGFTYRAGSLHSS